MNSRFFTTRLRRACNRVCPLLLALGTFASTATASTLALDFACISHNSYRSCATGERQIRAELSLSTADTATFRFSNVGNEASVVGQIYFDDPGGHLHSISELSFGTNGLVNFARGARPSHLPGGKAPAIAFNTDFSLGAANPGPRNGLNNGAGSELEQLSVSFLLDSDFAALRSALASGELRLGIHAQAFEGGFSESFVSQPPAAAVPVPETVWLFASGLFGFVGIARRRREKHPGAVNN
jgi:hypothetical protein